jgi:hypothetical protein
MNKYKLEQSKEKQGWWVLTDTINLIVIKFQEGKFNDTQKVTLLNGDDFSSMEDAMKQVKALREMADWLAENHYKIAMG